MLFRKTVAIAAMTGALAALAVNPAAAAAATVATGKACYEATGIGKGANIAVSGSGFTPGEEVFAQIPAPGGLLGFVETTVAPDGSIATTLPDISPETIDPVAEKRVMQIKGVLSSQILAEVPFELTNLAVRTKPPTASYGKVVTYTFSGFRGGKPIFGHYLRHNHLVVTHKFGKAKGACGLLSAKAKLFPGHGPATAKYKVQFDTHRKYLKKASPKIVTGLGTAF